ncbi:RsmB/NOP family class I SAM-dependent RNA methyltransferase [Halocatena pleomorpha]|uniref:RsmB/NOP family class I SAM-dependent RNA methyltransferase n=1 Tax=Halocatena pleomorpha TaxID=1785090 RepID=A0A3P3RCH0_9EURY|nr:RsmB/NOP family class I SAM-dependent RNA methyltransferase [Halocatena pleomorpha]RRJ31156.1 RsmB/NOP family class I SAM-dependent RNA methyltransferase [Halocatena pleomorpha]
MVLSRYRPLIEEFEAFLAACERPLPSVVRVNTLKATVDRVREALDSGGYAYESCEWNPELLRLETSRPGNSWPYVHGWIYGQEEVSALPALVLDLKPGDRVFDACAAPGSKTTQLAALMEDTGTLVANDANLGRLSALRSNAERCGVTNCVVTSTDAQTFSLDPFNDEPFDHALVDVPCSCEGTIRKNPTALDEWSLDRVTGIAGVQRGILERAVQMTRAGGTVVYSTCTFAPEENEAVLDHVLETEPCRLVEFDAPLTTRPGVTEWNGEQYDPSVQRAKRIYPHLNDTGGFFCAKLEVDA